MFKKITTASLITLFLSINCGAMELSTELIEKGEEETRELSTAHSITTYSAGNFDILPVELNKEILKFAILSNNNASEHNQITKALLLTCKSFNFIVNEDPSFSKQILNYLAQSMANKKYALMQFPTTAGIAYLKDLCAKNPMLQQNLSHQIWYHMLIPNAGPHKRARDNYIIKFLPIIDLNFKAPSNHFSWALPSSDVEFLEKLYSRSNLINQKSILQLAHQNGHIEVANEITRLLNLQDISEKKSDIINSDE